MIPAGMEPTKPGPATLVQYNTVYNNCREEEAEPAVEDKPDVNFVQPLSTTVVTHLKFNHIYVRMMGGVKLAGTLFDASLIKEKLHLARTLPSNTIVNSYVIKVEIVIPYNIYTDTLHIYIVLIQCRISGIFYLTLILLGGWAR